MVTKLHDVVNGYKYHYVFEGLVFHEQVFCVFS